MALVLKQPIARLHKKEQHVRIKPLHTRKRKTKSSKPTAKKTARKVSKRSRKSCTDLFSRR